MVIHAAFPSAGAYAIAAIADRGLSAYSSHTVLFELIVPSDWSVNKVLLTTMPLSGD